eukprot:4889107-Lingulodinium_polyedra.AAC.1
MSRARCVENPNEACLGLPDVYVVAAIRGTARGRRQEYVDVNRSEGRGEVGVIGASRALCGAGERHRMNCSAKSHHA